MSNTGAAQPHTCPHMRMHVLADLYNRVETQPGLDRFVDDPVGLDSVSLGPLLEWARAVVPQPHHASTPLHLLATAGVRRLPQPQQVWVPGVDVLVEQLT